MISKLNMDITIHTSPQGIKVLRDQSLLSAGEGASEDCGGDHMGFRGNGRGTLEIDCQ